ncbi:MAG TPA: thymidine phosphorylase [Planctomycetaceae bacterium]|nr:thymidine phosphorylase [Planctomycetaceae bacterium]
MPLNPAHIIARKRDGHALEPDDIGAFIRGYVRGEIPDYQMSALAMAIYFRGMTPIETATLTREMLNSGSRLSWPRGLPKVDKHSTGGVGDKVSLILAPLLACCGVQVPMISGRGLGATGGTLDKLESIPGFRTDLSDTEIARVVETVGCVITGQTADLVPADKWLYALRDVTATVASVPLITASIMSKKLAEGLDALVLDVKFGSGAFMKSEAQARELAQSLTSVGAETGLRTSALLTDMNQPLGRLCGNAVEVDESVSALKGDGPHDLMELTFALGAELLALAGVAANVSAGTAQLRRVLDSGAGYEKFREMVHAQGGDLDAPRPVAPATDVVAGTSGFVTAMDCEALGQAVVIMGGGRWQVTDQVDFSVGLEMRVRIGDEVTAGQPLVRVFATPGGFEKACDSIRNAIVIGAEPVTPPLLILDRIAP